MNKGYLNISGSLYSFLGYLVEGKNRADIPANIPNNIWSILFVVDSESHFQQSGANKCHTLINKTETITAKK